MINLKEINHFGQKINKVTKVISDLNAIDQVIKGNTKPIKRKIKNKIKKKIINKIF